MAAIYDYRAVAEGRSFLHVAATAVGRGCEVAMPPLIRFLSSVYIIRLVLIPIVHLLVLGFVRLRPVQVSRLWGIFLNFINWLFSDELWKRVTQKREGAFARHCDAGEGLCRWALAWVRACAGDGARIGWLAWAGLHGQRQARLLAAVRACSKYAVSGIRMQETCSCSE